MEANAITFNAEVVAETVVDRQVAAFHERYWIKWVKIAVDLMALQLSLGVGYYFRHAFDFWFPVRMSPDKYAELAFGMLLVPVGYWLLRLYPGYGLSAVERMRRRVRATLVMFMMFATCDFLLDDTGWSRGVLLSAFGFALIIPSLLQGMTRSLLISRNWWGTPVLVLGAAKTAACVVTALMNNPETGLRPVAILDDDERKWGIKIAGIPIVGGIKRAREFTDKLQYVLLALPGAGRDLHLELVQRLPFQHVIVVPDLIGLQSLWVEARDLCGTIGVDIQKNLLIRRNRYFKRFMDYSLGIPLFLLSLPILALFALWIMLVSPGNPFYFQTREGRVGRKVKVWKLRTMHPAAENLLYAYLESNPAAKREWNQYFKLRHDPRILKGVGSLLRKTSLDELPQLWNVLRGEMSLVGPRPFPHYHLQQFDADFCELRRSVLPGMTGLWQVSARSDGDLKVQESLDTYYIRNWSIWLDLDLLGKTFWIVMNGKGAY